MILLDSHQIEISLATFTKKISSEQINQIVKELTLEERKLPNNNYLLIIDSGSVAGFRHLKACVHFSLQAFKQKNNLAKTLNTEILLYLSGYRQISKAIKKVGLNVESKEAITIHIKLNHPEENHSPKRKEFFNFEKFLKARNIEYTNFQLDVSDILVTDEKKIMLNLEIVEKEIQLFLKDTEDSRDDIIEKIAIEKSALLNILK
ncbi:MAG: KEOPS complex subunit Cgi121 [Candidatus Heimdallarchaeota archaeon]